MTRWVERRRRNRFRRLYNNTPSRFKRIRWVVFLTKLVFLGTIIFILGMFIIIPIFTFILPPPENIVRSEGFSTKILDRNGKVLYDIFQDQKRTPIEFSEMSDFLKKATVSIEDKNFYKHQGFDITGMARAVVNIFLRGRLQGGSTLTQQLVKNVLLSPERTIFRKVKEFILSIQIERKFSKDQILQMYLNESGYGGNLYGVEAASETYFGKKAIDLNLVESAILAGLPQSPSRYSPYSSTPQAYKDRTKQVLRRMKEDGYISSDDEKKALNELESVNILERGSSFKAPHFVLYVQKILEERYGVDVVEKGGLKVTTSIDLDLQDAAQKIVSEEIEKTEKSHITNGAAIVINPETGEILAMVGSKDFNAADYDGQVNVTLSLRQPGSAIKPFTYVTAFSKGYSASTLIMDVPTKFYGGEGLPDYEPVNYDGKNRGPIQLRYALGNSINIPAVKVLAMVGVKDVLQKAFDLGITSLEPNTDTLKRVGLSLTLGGGEVRLIDISTGYSAFVNGGFRIEPTSILKVEDRKGKILENNEPKKGKRILTPEEAYMIIDILSDNEARKEIFGLNSLLYIKDRQIAVKTGTTNDKRDNWTIGGNMQTMVGVWVGNNDNSPMKEVASGVSGASPIWRRIILEALKGKPNLTFEVPGGIVSAAVDTISGYAAHDGYPSRVEKFIDGTQPNEDPVHVKLKVCKSDGKLASPADISNGNYEEKEYFIFKEKDPSTKSSENRWQDGINNWLSGQSDSRYHPPSDYCGTGNPVSVEFIYPKDQSSNLSNKFTIEIRADSLNKIVSVSLEIDGQKIATLMGRPFKYEADLSDGIHILKARAMDEKGNESERSVTIGVNTIWNYTPSPTQTLTVTTTPLVTAIPTI